MRTRGAADTFRPDHCGAGSGRRHSAAALARLGITVGTHIRRCAQVEDRAFADLEKDVATLSETVFPTLDIQQGEAMQAAILAAKAERDSVGGVVETAVLGMPCGVGEPWFDSVEGLLSHALFSLGGIKGVEFGDGFALAEGTGASATTRFGWKMGMW